MEEFISFSKDMKYLALYWALGFTEQQEDIFIKNYGKNNQIKIDANNQKVEFLNGISIVNDEYFEIKTHKSFVILECINALLEMGYNPSNIIIDLNNEYDIYCKNLCIKCYEWGTIDKEQIIINNHEVYSIIYSSRLTSGAIERITKIFNSNHLYDYGIFESTVSEKYILYNKENVNSNNPDFVINGDKLVAYKGKDKKVIVPSGIVELGSSCFWDNSFIEEVILPDSLINLGGDTFYNCKNLKHVVIPKNVKTMGNNPFAGCPELVLENKSSSFIYKNGALMNKDKTRLIYYSIKAKNTSYKIPSSITIVGKHCFYLCDNLETITIPKSVIKLENNPFSGCSKLKLINHSDKYVVIDDVIYNSYKTMVIGALNSIKTESLKLLPVKSISRNSFWNCKGIKEIVFPETLEQIGYNPFVGCSNIHFVSNSKNYLVEDGILFNKDKSKIICYPSWKAIGEVNIPESVITLERGAFSGCDKMTKINLHNINFINKSCFTNCSSLQELYCSDFLTFIGEWAFAYCSSLEEVSIYKDTILDKNVFSNCNAKLTKRNERSNYVIESDNLYTLKSLELSLKGKIDSILIDPPYNSHIDYIGYKDGNYSDYHAFIKQRLDLAYGLLSNKGFLVLNIDEGEANNLFNLCKSIFGNELVSLHKWKKIHPYFDANRVILNPNKKQTDYEYIIICRKSSNSILNKIKQPYIENGILKEQDADVPETFDCFGTTSSAKDEINELFGRRDYFSTPKPVKLIKELLRATSNKDSIVLDFFAGSGTLAQATIELNKEDGGNRHYIMVSNSESNICKTVTLKRAMLFDKTVNFIK